MDYESLQIIFAHFYRRIVVLNCIMQSCYAEANKKSDGRRLSAFKENKTCMPNGEICILALCYSNLSAQIVIDLVMHFGTYSALTLNAFYCALSYFDRLFTFYAFSMCLTDSASQSREDY